MRNLCSLSVFVILKSHKPLFVVLIGELLLLFFGRSTNALIISTGTFGRSACTTGSKGTSFISSGRKVVPNIYCDAVTSIQQRLSRSDVGGYHHPHHSNGRNGWRNRLFVSSKNGLSFISGTRTRHTDRIQLLRMVSSLPPSRTTTGIDSNNNNHTNSTDPTTATTTRTKQEKFLPLSVRRRLEKEQQEQQLQLEKSTSDTVQYDRNKMLVRKSDKTVTVETSQQKQDYDDNDNKRNQGLHFISLKGDQSDVEQNYLATEVTTIEEKDEQEDNDDGDNNQLMDETTQSLLLEIIQAEYESKIQNIQNELEIEVGLLKANQTIQLQELQTQLRTIQVEHELTIQTLEEKLNKELKYQQFVIKTNEFIANQDKQRMEYEYEQMELAYQRQIIQQVSHWITAEQRSNLFSQKVKEQTKFIASLRKENSSIPSMFQKILFLMKQRVKSKDCHKLKKGKNK